MHNTTAKTSSASPAELLAAFMNTRYRVAVAGGVVEVSVGSTSPALDVQLELPDWFIITAFNPRGAPQPNRQNLQAHATLGAQLQRAFRDRTLPAVNRDPAGLWPDEPGWLVQSRGHAGALALADRFDQCALIAGRRGQPAELWLCRADWPGELPEHVRAIGQ